MRTFGFLINKNSSLHEARIPGARMARLNQSLRRRLDDDVEEVFNRACTANDLEAAADLLAVLEKWHARRSASYGRERRINGASVARVRRELERLQTLRGARPEDLNTRFTPAAGVSPRD